MSETPPIDPRLVAPDAPAPAGRRDGSRPDEEREQPIVRDKRRIDPVTGRLREPAGTAAGPLPPSAAGAPGPAAGAAAAGGPEPDAGGGGQADAEAVTADIAALGARVAELTDDLQRLSAEYANYRRRVERDREAMAGQAAAAVLAGLLPALDDIERARRHGDLQGSFKAVAETVEKVAANLGLAAYGEPGDPFDPTVHEALLSQPSPDVAEPSVTEVYARGYRVGDRVLRAAQVVVAAPA